MHEEGSVWDGRRMDVKGRIVPACLLLGGVMGGSCEGGYVCGVGGYGEMLAGLPKTPAVSKKPGYTTFSAIQQFLPTQNCLACMSVSFRVCLCLSV